jgi:hypothetical protein
MHSSDGVLIAAFGVKGQHDGRSRLVLLRFQLPCIKEHFDWFEAAPE